MSKDLLIIESDEHLSEYLCKLLKEQAESVYGGPVLILDKGLKAKRLVDTWISVEDQLPNEWKASLAFCGNDKRDIHVCYCQPSTGEWEYENGMVATTVTHWMPLPAPPEVTA